MSVGRTCGESSIVTCEATPQWLSVCAEGWCGFQSEHQFSLLSLSLGLPLSIYLLRRLSQSPKSVEREDWFTVVYCFPSITTALNSTLQLNFPSLSLSLLFHELKAWNELPPLLHRSNLTPSRYSLCLVVCLNQSRFTLLKKKDSTKRTVHCFDCCPAYQWLIVEVFFWIAQIVCLFL